MIPGHRARRFSSLRISRFACVALLVLAGAAQAQLRTIPEDAKRATMSHVEGMIVEMNGKRTQLATGAQIRNPNNMIVLPTALPANSLVRFTTDMQGQVWRIWILSPQEAAQPDPKK